MKFQKRNKEIKKVVKAPPVEIPDGLKEMAQTWQDHQKKQQEELAAQTWPTWLLPKGFRAWYENEQKWRKTQGMVQLPDPPMDVIYKVFYENNTDL